MSGHPVFFRQRRRATASVMSVETSVVGGLALSDVSVYTWPLIELRATEECLTFRARFGLGRFVGPWRLDRTQVRAISVTEGRVQRGIEILGLQGQRWVFFALSRPKAQVVDDLATLGYPSVV
jgi:hypothetical protein